VVGDEPPLLPKAARAICPDVRVAGWSERADEDLRPDGIEVDHWGVYGFGWHGERVVLSLPGRHAVTNALLALAVADLLGVAPRTAVQGLATVEVRALRGEFRRIGDLTVLVDCYNANPQSVRAALDLLADQAEASGRVAVLGTMLELGDASERLHREVLEDVLSRELDLVVATGAFADAAAASSVRSPVSVLTASDWREAYPALRDRLEGHEVILLKASRGIAMEGLLPMLEADFAPEPSAGGASEPPARDTSERSGREGKGA
jgi:UDP-N-acetylmuramoyl-tripeptide--D-alanyl-D-alanine ligase